MSIDFLDLNTKVWIFIPLYNGIEFLNDALMSIANQTHQDYKVLVGINGLQEKNAMTVEDFLNHVYYEKYPWLFIKRYDTVGKPATLNAMLADTKSEYVALLDVDDAWEQSKLNAQLSIFEQNPDLNVVGTLCQYFGSKSYIPSLPTGMIDRGYFPQRNPMINSSVLIRRDQDLNWNESLSALEDYELWLRWNHMGKKFYNIDRILTFHRIHEQSHFNTKNHSTLEFALKSQWQV